MLWQKGLKISLGMFGSVLLLAGCSSIVFPDFDDDKEVVIQEGGRVEMREIKENGILVADKDNAAYEDDDTENGGKTAEKNVEETEKVTPAKVVEVKAEEIVPINDNVRVVEGNVDEAGQTESEIKTPSMHYLAATVYFENGGSVVANSYNAELRKIARLVKENDGFVTVYGFASSRTRDTDPASHKLANFKISAERAESAAKALRRAGVPADKISAQALSDTMPMYQEVMPEGERLNRRAEIYLTY